MSVLCLDLGGTKLMLAQVEGKTLLDTWRYPVPADGNFEQLFDFLVTCIHSHLTPETYGISIGIPGMVDMHSGTLLEVLNIPALTATQLAQQLKNTFEMDVVVNNDANLFALGEAVLNHNQDMLGITLGTGVGAGVIFNGQLYSGKHCAAGEIGSLSYRDGIIEHYCSGQYFTVHHQMSGEHLYQKACEGDSQALQAFVHFGEHLAHMIAQTLLVYDPKDIILGGSVSQSFPFFIEALKQKLQSLVYGPQLADLTISASQHHNAALIGAAQWFLQQQKSSGFN